MKRGMDSIDLRTRKPLDKRLNCQNKITIDLPYNGLKTFQESDKKYYKYVDGEWSLEKYREITSLSDYNPIGDSISDDTLKLQYAINDTILNSSIMYKKPLDYKITEELLKDNVSMTDLSGTKNGGVLNILIGKNEAPSTFETQPSIFVQKFINKDTGYAYNHQIGVGLFEVIAKGSDNVISDNKGTWIALCGNTVADSKNKGNESVPKYDYDGNVIGVFGQAEAKGLIGNGGIITGVWASGVSPEINDTVFDSTTDSWTTCGIEVNVWTRHKDAGDKPTLYGKGTTVGIFMNNYDHVGNAVHDWTFGLLIAGSPSDGNYLNNNVDNWNGHHTGILLNMIKNRGILFGPLMKNNSYGIEFTTNYWQQAQRPKAGIFMGDTQLNWGNYAGSVWNDGDMWKTGNSLYFKKGGTTEELFGSKGVFDPIATVCNKKIMINVGGVDYFIMATTLQ